MADSQPDQSEKTEQASTFKLEESKKKGSVFKSLEVNHWFALATGLVLLWSVADKQTAAFFTLCHHLFKQAGQLNFDAQALVVWGEQVAMQVGWILSPLLALLVVGVLSTLLQTGPVFTFFPMKPDFSRINPIKGFKRLFSKKTLFEFGKSLFKLILFTSVMYFSIISMLPDLFGLAQKSPQTAASRFINDFAELLFKLLLALAFVALIDFIFSRWEFMRNMRMTKREVKDEAKQREGDPHIRSKRKELEREMRKRSASAASVPQADLIITNPDHYAVVIKYDRSKMSAPIVTGKGIDAMAQHLKDLARIHQVPIIADPPLARRLYRTTSIGKSVPEETFIAVARVLRQAYVIRRRQGRSTPRWTSTKEIS